MFKKQNAFTLIELIVTVAVIAIVVGMAVPAFNAMVIKSRSAALGTDMLEALNYTRSEAVKRGARVSICPSTDGLACLDATNWAKGWMVFVDGALTDGAAVVITTPLRHWNDINSNAVVTATQGVGGAAIAFTRFSSTGMLARLNAADTKSRLFKTYVTKCKGDAANDIAVGIAGMITVTKANCP
jgi:type IV fimbrial biogenesis protein FimT